MIYPETVTVLGEIFSFDAVREALTERSRGLIDLTEVWRGQDISNLFQPLKSECTAFTTSNEPFIDCSISNPLDSSIVIESTAGRACPERRWLPEPVGRLYLTWENVASYSFDLFVYNGKVLNASAYINSNDPRNLTFAKYTTSTLASALGTDGTKSLLRTRESQSAVKCLLQTYTIGDIGQETIGCVASNTVIIAVLVVVLGVLGVK